MTKTALMIVFFCLSGMEALAQTTLKVPDDASPRNPFIKKDLPGPVTVDNRFFSVSVPKGWSVESVGASVKFLDGITVTPTSDIENERTYLGVHTLRETVEWTLEKKQAYEKAKLKPNEELGYESWQGRTWLVKQYPCQSGQFQSPAFCWVAWGIDRNRKVGVLVASTPVTQASRYEGFLKAMMQSVKFHPPDR